MGYPFFTQHSKQQYLSHRSGRTRYSVAYMTAAALLQCRAILCAAIRVSNGCKLVTRPGGCVRGHSNLPPLFLLTPSWLRMIWLRMADLDSGGREWRQARNKSEDVNLPPCYGG